MAEREAGAGHDECERRQRGRVGDGSRARLRQRDDDAAEPRRERRDVDGDEQHGDRRRQAVEPVGVSRLDERDDGTGGGDRPLRPRRRAADGAGERPEADGGPEPERRRGARSSSSSTSSISCGSNIRDGARSAVWPSRATGSATIISTTPAETSRHSRAVIPPERSAANGTPKPSANPSSESQRPSTSRMRPARAGPGRTAFVGSPTLKKNAPRAGWESEPTASHSTT